MYNFGIPLSFKVRSAIRSRSLMKSRGRSQPVTLIEAGKLYLVESFGGIPTDHALTIKADHQAKHP
jgi:hypothetical protein